MEQNNINKRSGRKCQDFDEAEKAYQEAQKEWKENLMRNHTEWWERIEDYDNNIC